MAKASYYNMGSDEYIDAKCSLCADKNIDQIAERYCYDCQKHLCKTCLGTHNNLNTNHIEGNGDDKYDLTEKCGTHEDELITLFCLQHNELMCIQCRCLDHSTCKEVKHIKESARQPNAETDLQTTPAQLQSALDKIQKAIESLDNDVAFVKNMESGFLKDLELFAKKLLSRINDLKQKGKRAIKSKQKQLVSDFKWHRKGCILAKNDIVRCLDAIKNPNQLKTNLFILKKKAQTIITQVEGLCQESDNLVKRCQFNFMTDSKITDSLNRFNSLVEEVSTTVQEIRSFDSVGRAAEGPIGDYRVEKQEEWPDVSLGEKRGDMLVDRLIGEREDRPPNWPGENRGDGPLERQLLKKGDGLVNRLGGKQEYMTVETPGPTQLEGNASYIIKLLRNIKVRIPMDKTACSIQCCCRLSDGCLLIADLSNKKLKRIDPSNGTVSKYCDTNTLPLDVCCIGPGEVAVALSLFKQIHVYSAATLDKIRTIQLGHFTSKMACHGGRLYAAYLNTIYIHDLSDGRKLREIPQVTDDQNPFSYIVLNGPGDRLYVSDYTKGLRCVNTDGQLIFHLNQEDLGLNGARGVSIDHRGHVFVLGVESNNVVEVTKEGRVVRELSIEDEIWRPYCLCYDVDRNRLYIGGNSDQLLEFELTLS